MSHASSFRRPSSALADRLELFFGDANPATARVYAQVELDQEHQRDVADLRLTGYLSGPQCEFAHTLSARIPFLNGSPEKSEKTLLAKAVVPDPCFWTPELPFLYHAQLQLHRGESIVSQTEATLGIRRLGVRGRHLYFEGKRFVLRGVYSTRELSERDFDYNRQTWTAAAVPWPSIELCQRASQRGILLVADLRRVAGDERSEPSVSVENVAAALRSLASWPAVAIAIVDTDTIPLLEITGAVKNLLIGQYIRAGQPLEINDKSQVIFAEVTDPAEFAPIANSIDRPIIAVRRLPEALSLDQARPACDTLQRDLAPVADLAGYIV